MELGVPQISPSKWGAEVDYDSWHDKSRYVTTVFLHWPGTLQTFKGGIKESSEALKSYEQYHLSKEWRGLAYDYAIDLNGNFFRARGLGQSAATGGDIDEDGIPNNVESDAILLLVGPKQSLSLEMIATLATVLRNHKHASIYGHRESAKFGTGTATSCPGDLVMRWLDAYRSDDYTPPVDKEDELTHLSEDAQKWLQEFYEVGQDHEDSSLRARPTSLWYVLDWFRSTRSFFERGPE